MSSDAPPSYDPRAVETRRQQAWRERDAFRTPDLTEETQGLAEGGQGLYIKPSAPFTSGNIHIGHVRSYAIGDAYARFQRARGEQVLFAFGFDAFGLPAELGAIAGGVSPSEWVQRCAQHMIGQLERLGFSFDWERTFMSSDPVMYRWSQWLFLTLLEHGLIYHGTGNVDWCDTCQTTLATIQVEDGLCWRCHNPVRLIVRPEWYLKISAYVEENDSRLAALEPNWDETSLASQRFVLGRVDGVELDLVTAQRDDGADAGAGEDAGVGAGEDALTLTVFTPHPDALAQARFVLLSPKHPDVDDWAKDPAVQERLEELRSGGWERSERDADAIPLVDTGRRVSMPTIASASAETAGAETSREDGRGHGDADTERTTLPVLISPLVDGRFGATAVLGIPQEDHTDAVIAERLWGAPTDPPGPPPAAPSSPSPPSSATARAAVRYRAGDFTISRQRSWGTPIPIVYCERCGTMPLSKEQLPVELPLDLKPTGEGNPLAEREDFVQTTCPRCGGEAKRETDTLDCHFDALWLWIPACVPAQARGHAIEDIFALPDLRRWLPSERLVAGTDSGNFVFDQRVVTKALRDIGPLAFLQDGEPFAGCLFHEMVIRDGRKMSKHLGNVVDPDELLEAFGADTLRLAVLYAARPQKSLNWSDSAVQHCHRFLKGLWTYTQARLALDPGTLDEQGVYHTEFLRRRLEKWSETAVQKITEDLTELEMHKAVRDVMRLLDRVKDFEKKVIARTGGTLGRENHSALLAALALLAQVLTPLAPHLGEELWLALAGEDATLDPPWPQSVGPAEGPLLAQARGLPGTETVTSAGRAPV
jgi:leucyl-tRNA synthetase